MKRSGKMNLIKKLTAVAASVVLAASFAAPVTASGAAGTDFSVEQEYYAGSKISVSKLKIAKISDQVYTGKALKPKLTVKYGSKTLKSGTDYTLTFKNNKNVGTATVTITGKGKYTGTKKVTLKILPAAPSVKVKADGGKITLSWAKAKGASGYQISYSANGGAFKTLTSTTKTSYSTTKLDNSKNGYTFRVRSYKTVSGKKYYSKWSANVSLAKNGSSGSTDPVVTPGDDPYSKLVDISDGKAGKVKILSYYDITTDPKGDKQSLIFQSEAFGGSIEYISAPYPAYVDKLGVLISADDSPDLVMNDVFMYPYTVSRGYFQPLDNYIDLKSSLWKDMKPVADTYAWEGKHYYVPHTYVNTMALNYNRKTIAENGLPDPYELYMNGDWTWDTWRGIMEKFCAKSDDNIGYYATDYGFDALILTTGTPLIGINGGKVSTNFTNANVKRTMDFLDDLRISGLGYDFQYGDWVSPNIFATASDKILFLVMEPEWTYTAATSEIQNPVGVDNDILDTVSDFAFVPMPRDPNADAYYQSGDTFGYLVPQGARNIHGAVTFIELCRAYATDKTIQAQVKKDKVSPEPVTYTTGKYEGKRRWTMTWDAQLYDLLCEMRDPGRFSLVFENAYDVGYDFNDSLSSSITYSALYGESWTDKAEWLEETADAYLGEYYS